MAKMTNKEQASARKELYDIALSAIAGSGRETEVISDGALIHLGNERYAKLKISICNADTFNLEETRAAYQKKLEKVKKLSEEKSE